MRRPATGPHPDAFVMHSPEVRELAREAVRESLVLLKNDRGILPLRRTGRILVVGKGADSLPMQAGGWSLTWQGDKTKTSDYPHADTLLSALSARSLGRRPRRLQSRRHAASMSASIARVVYGRRRRALCGRCKGDISFPASMRHTSRYPQDLAALERVSAKGRSSRDRCSIRAGPFAANDLINRSDAFIAAWLPGTEGLGLVDMLLAPANGQRAFDFKGRLSFDWPTGDCLPWKGGIQFRSGYGLTLASRTTLGKLPDSAPVMACPAESR